ncbi:MAG: type II CRISPR-associated endonuclease Cas1 [Bacteroidales bacterium]|nr:type II CRISPR-associated endonuclease Cas1 [Bacteroidales bacterium]
MIKRTLYFGSNTYLSTKEEQLVVKFEDINNPSAKIPIEDIGVIILDAHRLTISQTLISKLLHNNVALITCDEKHMPQGLMLNLDGNTVQQERYKYQTEASLPLKKNLWQQTIKAKIRNQRTLLMNIGIDTMTSSHRINKKPFENMQYWEQSVKSGDPDNYEGRAAAFYWKTLFADIFDNFKRGRFEKAPNNLLNYGYAVLRAVIARSLTASGLLPLFGIHHHNKYNAYALADDIMEPYRPFVDAIVRDLCEKYYSDDWNEKDFELTPEIKKELLQIPVLDVIIDNKRSPLMNASHRTAASLFQCFAENSRKILYPEFVE